MRRYPEEIQRFIAENVQGRSICDLTALVNHKFGTSLSYGQIKSYMRNHGLKNGMPKGLPKGSLTSKYPQEVKEFIQANHLGVGPLAMAKLLNAEFGTSYTASQLKGYYANHKINSGLTGYFKKRACAGKQGDPSTLKGKDGRNSI